MVTAVFGGLARRAVFTVIAAGFFLATGGSGGEKSFFVNFSAASAGEREDRGKGGNGGSGTAHTGANAPADFTEEALAPPPVPPTVKRMA